MGWWRVAEKVGRWQEKLSGLDFGEPGRGREAPAPDLEGKAPDRQGPEKAREMGDLLRAHPGQSDRLAGEGDLCHRAKDAVGEKSFLKTQDHAVTREIER